MFLHTIYQNGENCANLPQHYLTATKFNKWP
jgi:hypothetical protein